jgi:hypothetical protein
MGEARVSEPDVPFRDRGPRLALCGFLVILAGSGAVLLGGLHALLLLGGPRVPGLESVPVDVRSSLTGLLLYLLLGAALIAVGVGSVRKRRWSRPLTLTLAWTWLLGGICLLFLLPAAWTLLAAGAPLLDPTVASLVRIVLLAGTAVFGVILPALLVVVYGDPHLRQTLEAHDPRPDWTERCPPSVLGLSLSLGACGVLTALAAPRPVVPWFGRLVVGWPGALLLLAGAGVCLWLAREIYALRPRGWWATTVFLVLLGLSTWLTLQRVPFAEMLRAMGWDEGLLPAGRTTLGPTAGWLTLALTVASVAYLVGIRKYFRSGSVTPRGRPA